MLAKWNGTTLDSVVVGCFVLAPPDRATDPIVVPLPSNDTPLWANFVGEFSRYRYYPFLQAIVLVPIRMRE